MVQTAYPSRFFGKPGPSLTSMAFQSARQAYEIRIDLAVQLAGD
jgi:hypothetical protein